MLTIVRVKLVPLERNLQLGRIVLVLVRVVVVRTPVTLRQSLLGAELFRVQVLLVSRMRTDLWLGLVHIVMEIRFLLW